MKTKHPILAGVSAAAILLGSVALAQEQIPQPVVTQQSNTGAGAENESKIESEVATGIIYRYGKAYVVNRDGKITQVNDATVPDGYMMTFDGKVVRAPDAITGVAEGVGVPKQTPATNNANPNRDVNANNAPPTQRE